MTYVCPCIFSIIVNDDQQDATTWVYLFIPNQLYMFRAIFRPSSGELDCMYSFWYCPPILLPAGVMDEMEPHPWPQRAAISVDIIRSCEYSQVLLMIGEDISRNM